MAFPIRISLCRIFKNFASPFCTPSFSPKTQAETDPAACRSPFHPDLSAVCLPAASGLQMVPRRNAFSKNAELFPASAKGRPTGQTGSFNRPDQSRLPACVSTESDFTGHTQRAAAGAAAEESYAQHAALPTHPPAPLAPKPVNGQVRFQRQLSVAGASAFVSPLDMTAPPVVASILKDEQNASFAKPNHNIQDSSKLDGTIYCLDL